MFAHMPCRLSFADSKSVFKNLVRYGGKWREAKPWTLFIRGKRIWIVMESTHRTNANDSCIAFALLRILYQHDVFNFSRMPVSGDSVQAGYEVRVKIRILGRGSDMTQRNHIHWSSSKMISVNIVVSIEQGWVINNMCPCCFEYMNEWMNLWMNEWMNEPKDEHFR